MALAGDHQSPGRRGRFRVSGRAKNGSRVFEPSQLGGYVRQTWELVANHEQGRFESPQLTIWTRPPNLPSRHTSPRIHAALMLHSAHIQGFAAVSPGNRNAPSTDCGSARPSPPPTGSRSTPELGGVRPWCSTAARDSPSPRQRARRRSKAIQHQRIDLRSSSVHVADAVEPRRVGMGRIESAAGIAERRERSHRGHAVSCRSTP